MLASKHQIAFEVTETKMMNVIDLKLTNAEAGTTKTWGSQRDVLYVLDSATMRTGWIYSYAAIKSV